MAMANYSTVLVGPLSLVRKKFRRITRTNNFKLDIGHFDTLINRNRNTFT